MPCAYVDKPLYCDGGPHDSVWCQYWSVITQHYNHCMMVSLVKITYVRILNYCVINSTFEFGYLYDSEHVIVSKGCDIHHLVKRNINL